MLFPTFPKDPLEAKGKCGVVACVCTQTHASGLRGYEALSSSFGFLPQTTIATRAEKERDRVVPVSAWSMYVHMYVSGGELREQHATLAG